MLRSAHVIRGYIILATDGEIGKIHDFLFDGGIWIVRYVVADTGKWIPGHKVLLPPLVCGEPDWQSQSFPVSLTREQVKNSPGIETEKPVSRQYEKKLYEHYGWAPYWIGGKAADMISEEESDEDPNLRSCEEVRGYHISALDGDIGHVDDFIIDDQDWTIRYVAVDTRNWLPGKKVLVSPHWISDVRWFDRRVAVDLTREKVKDSPEYDPDSAINREYEVRLYDYYGRPRYWEESFEKKKEK